MLKVFLFLLANSLWAQASYTIKDLRVLFEQRDFKEYFNHAKDVPPSQRQGEWEQMTKKMAMAYIESWEKKSVGVSAAEAKILDEISSWSTLKASEVFRMSLRPLRISQVDQCILNEEKACLDLAKKFFALDPHGEYGVKIAKKFKDLPLDEKEVFLTPILSSVVCTFYVDKEPTRAFVEKLLVQEPRRLANLKLDKDCKTLLAKESRKRFLETRDIGQLRKLKILLEKWKLFTSDDDHYFNLVVFLDGEDQSKSAVIKKWQSFRSLAENVEKRQEILNSLLTRRPLLGKVLYQEGEKSKAVLLAFKKYLPEYFISYGDLCLKYLKKSAPAPSLDCHQLFKRAKELELTSKLTLKSYEAL